MPEKCDDCKFKSYPNIKSYQNLMLISFAKFKGDHFSGKQVIRLDVLLSNIIDIDKEVRANASMNEYIICN